MAKTSMKAVLRSLTGDRAQNSYVAVPAPQTLRKSKDFWSNPNADIWGDGLLYFRLSHIEQGPEPMWAHLERENTAYYDEVGQEAYELAQEQQSLLAKWKQQAFELEQAKKQQEAKASMYAQAAKLALDKVKDQIASNVTQSNAFFKLMKDGSTQERKTPEPERSPIPDPFVPPKRMMKK